MPSNTLRLLDLFSGIGGFSYAAERIVGGYETVQFVEREPYCQQVLNRHWPGVAIHDDICTFQPELGFADVICGGFPCQDISTAGKRAGIKVGTRSGLFYELLRVVCLVRPKYIVLENVSAILSGGLDTVLGELAEAGFDAEWACIPASAVGACHRRDRWWLVAYPSGLCAEQRGEARNLARTAGASERDGEEWQRHGNASLDSGPTAADSQELLSDGVSGQQRRKPQACGRSQLALSQPGNGVGQVSTDSHGVPQQGSGAGGQCLQSSPGRAWGALWSDQGIHRLNPDWRSYLSEPVLCRGDDGLSNRVAKLKALGNSVVPQVAAIPLARVRQLHLQGLL